MRLPPVVLSSIALATSLVAQRVAELEPNDTLATAQVVTLGTQVDCTLTPNDADWFTFTLGAATRVRMQTSVPNQPGSMETILQVRNATGTQILGIDSAAVGSDSTHSSLTLQLDPGTYTLQVVGRYQYYLCSYSLDIAEVSPVTYSGTEVEPNGSVATAVPTVLTPGANRFAGTLAPATTVSNRAVSYGFIAVSGVGAQGGFSTDTMTVTNQTLTPGAYESGAYSLFIRGGTGPIVGQTRRILSNTATTITTEPFPAALGSIIADIYFTTSTHAIVTTVANMINGAWNAIAPGFGRYQVRFTSGGNNGLRRMIAANTNSWIRLDQPFPTRPGLNDAFVVEALDCDYWRVVLTAPNTGLWCQVVEGLAPWVFGHRVEMLTSAGQPVDSVTLGANSATTTSSAARTSERRVWPAGTYYLAVRPTDALVETPAPSSASNPTGNYVLEIHASPMDTGGIVVETEALGGPQSNHTAATATPIAPGQIGRGNLTISSGGDPSDWWGPIVITAPSTLCYQTRRGAAPFVQDTTIHLRDSSGALIATSTDGNLLSPPSHARGITGMFLLPQTYYLEVMSPGTDTATQEGNYELELGAVTEAPYVAASYADLGGNGLGCYSRVVLSAVSNGGSALETSTPTQLTPGAYDRGGYWLRMTSGANAGLVRPIVWNFLNQIRVSPAFPSPIAAFSTFDIVASPTLVPHLTGEVPVLGTTFARQLVGGPPSALYFHMIGFSDTLWAGSVPLPLDLASRGAPGCTGNIDPVLLQAGITDGSGLAFLDTNLPGASALRGYFWYEQAIVSIPTANAFGAALSNYRRVVVGDRDH